eukprot:gnl/MRDRNA2_/MRDRNA2_32590_c0_seq1.p1 gnl/MRDRNA2_/MRDRNA2_32590_c0~~gnl/MRDRNA2_/MRDRNA2_32590_c0_seq1.p1  ORF type:complete len:411 (-),score=71.56 gnl/MRDRNA2_/MRDRNA2_32590_c0_seq1:22-1254(-)
MPLAPKVAAPTKAKAGAPPKAKATPSSAHSEPYKLSDTAALELEILQELNRARTDPKTCSEEIRTRLQHFNGNKYFPPDRGGKTEVATKEGTAAVQDAITFLERCRPLEALDEVNVPMLRLAAEDHLVDLGSSGAIGHKGWDGTDAADRQIRYGQWTGTSGENLWFGRMGSPARQIIQDLIVDDGVPSRGHRLACFNDRYRVAGIRFGPHLTFGACCVMELATGSSDDPERVSQRIQNGPPTPGARKEIRTQWKLGNCPGCNQPIQGGSVLEALGNKWHKDCFRCQECSTPLVGVPYQEQNKLPFCKPCWLEKYGETCAGCGKKIEGPVAKVCGKTWHKDCLACGECKGPLSNKFANRNGVPICESCTTGSAGAGPKAKGKPAAKPKPKMSMGMAKNTVTKTGMSYADLM